MNKNYYWLIVIAAILAIYLLGNNMGVFSITGTETLTRNPQPTNQLTVNPGQSFNLVYTAVGVSGNWGVSIQDSISGGCTFPSGGNTYKSVILSEDGNTKTISITAPQSGSCVFTGDFQYGNSSIKSLNSLTITVCQRNGVADTNCDGLVSRVELGVILTNWVSGTATRTDLGAAIQSWASS